jgi:hypothetical protein
VNDAPVATDFGGIHTMPRLAGFAHSHTFASQVVSSVSLAVCSGNDVVRVRWRFGCRFDLVECHIAGASVKQKHVVETWPDHLFHAARIVTLPAYLVSKIAGVEDRVEQHL